MRALNSAGYGGFDFGIGESSTHSGKDSTKRDQLHYKPRTGTAPGADAHLLAARLHLFQANPVLVMQPQPCEPKFGLHLKL
jgi:hypothetical protein